MIVSYWIIVGILLALTIVAILSNFNVILKNNCIGYFLRSSTFKYIIKRILFALVSMFFIITLTFFLIRIMPKDYFNNQLDYKINNVYFGLDNSNKNIFKQLLEYYYNILPFPKKVCVGNYLDGNNLTCSGYEYKIINLGNSVSYMKNVSVWSIIKEKSFSSFIVGFSGFLLQCLIGYPLGIYIARKQNGIADKTSNFLNIIIIAIPSILYFYSFVMLFMVVFKLPVSFQIDNLLSYIAPLVALSMWGGFTIAYWVKKYILTEANSDYVKFARSKGLNEKTIFYKHIIRNALTPLIRTIPTSLVLCFNGFYILEASFNIPGIGLTLISAINLQDVYLVQGLVIYFGFLTVISYLMGDLITILINHKVNFDKGGDVNEK